MYSDELLLPWLRRLAERIPGLHRRPRKADLLPVVGGWATKGAADSPAPFDRSYSARAVVTNEVASAFAGTLPLTTTLPSITSAGVDRTL